MQQIAQSPDEYLVVGNPIGHSKSPQIHQLFAQQTKQDLTYRSHFIELGQFDENVVAFQKSNIKGINVTLPFKQLAWSVSQKLSSCAQLAGAVNTLSFRDNVIYGDNTDGIGLVTDLKVNNGLCFEGCNILILGAGGAVRGVLQAIIDQNPASITIANRTLATAHELATLFAAKFSIEAVEYSDLNRSYDLIINGTSASLNKELLPVPNIIVDSNSYLYDMMYSVEQTVFNKWGEDLGAKNTSDGLGMLVEQAAEAFYLWRNVRPETKSVISLLRQAL
ncbi:MAG: shikimate dehydrogenase [Oceanospirillaceae bacterium]